VGRFDRDDIPTAGCPTTPGVAYPCAVRSDLDRRQVCGLPSAASTETGDRAPVRTP
jgi:hypothetical protein